MSITYTTDREHAAAALERLILDFEMDIDQVEKAWSQSYAFIGPEVLAEIWVDVMSTLPELN